MVRNDVRDGLGVSGGTGATAVDMVGDLRELIGDAVGDVGAGGGA